VAAAAAWAWAADEDRPASRWLVGDLHVHVSPPDTEGHSTLTVQAAIDAARRAGLDFVALTPHRADARFGAESGQALVRRVAREHLEAPPADDEPAPAAITVLAGWEWTRPRPGHLGVLFADVEELAGRADAAERALAAGALVVVNHPFLGPVDSAEPLLRMLRTDRRWRPFQEGRYDGAFNAIEVWHDRSVWVQRLHAQRADAPAEALMLKRSLEAWDAVTAAARRRITAVGGSDAHGRLPYTLVPMATTSVLVDDSDAGTTEALREGLLAARVTFGAGGGVAARDLTATSDVEGERARIGESVRARKRVTLRWTGRARLVENGRDVGEHGGGAVRELPEPGAFAFWRIEKPGDAYSNMVYANLPRPPRRDANEER
jgi:hypothetical protein